MPENPQTLGEHVLRRRLHLRLSQSEVAERIGVTEDSITGWENGRSAPQIRLYPAIIAFLGYYPFEKDLTTVSGQIEFVRNANGWNYGRMAKEFPVDATTVIGWQGKNRISANCHKQILAKLLQQCLSK
ncbi:helix-turn-helix domain-containing protein [Mucilaginibacter sp. HD30]